MKILFIGIYDNKEPQLAMRAAFKKASSEYHEISTLSNIAHEVRKVKFIPDLVFMQLQGTPLDKSILQRFRSSFIVQWTGDARQPMPGHYIFLGKKINLSLFTNTNDVETMRKSGCAADYLQISADHNIYNPEGNKAACPDVVFMANNYTNRFALSNYRYDMVKYLKESYGNRFGVYGAGWRGLETANFMFKQSIEASIYRGCKIAINCSHYDLGRYTSDRMFRIMMSGAFCLTKSFPKMEEYDGMLDTFNTYPELKEKIDYYLLNPDKAKEIAMRGMDYVRANCLWDNRVNELLTLKQKYENMGR